MEQEIRSGQPPASQEALNQAIDVTLAAIATLSFSTASVADCDWSRATALCNEINDLLDDGEFIPVELVAEIQKVLPDPAMRDDLACLMDQVTTLDYAA